MDYNRDLRELFVLGDGNSLCFVCGDKVINIYDQFCKYSFIHKNVYSVFERSTCISIKLNFLTLLFSYIVHNFYS